MTNWREIPGEEGRYEISNHGDLRSMDRQIIYTKGRWKNRKEFKKGKPMKPIINNAGYLTTVLSGKPYGIHVLVYKTFKGTIPNGMVVDHIDRNRLNNHIDNLRLLTQRKNTSNRGSKIGMPLGVKRAKLKDGSFVYKTTIRFNKRMIYLGQYKNISFAKYVYRIAVSHIEGTKDTTYDSIRSRINAFRNRIGMKPLRSNATSARTSSRRT